MAWVGSSHLIIIDKMESLNDKITTLLLEINQFCFVNQIDLEIESTGDDVKSSIKRIKKDEEVTILITLGEYDDEAFLKKLTKFRKNLKVTP